ncbi:DinB family protein [candidate division WWE3 bacterium]|uniref:DinB family protein n=1 Tax=candidate division WWE3 bacterium TaxID=2053526 RepID=A0A955LWL7_UNCKA|nr:DinB family protein [candidate division WWE3 bacterium]
MDEQSPETNQKPVPGQEQVIQQLQRSHEQLQQILHSVSTEQIQNAKLTDTWTTKDIIAHLAVWNWEMINEIQRILEDGATWDDYFVDEEKRNEFDINLVAERAGHSLDDVIKEWENSFQTLILTIQHLDGEQWQHQSSDSTWSSGHLEGQPITVYSLFDRISQGETHEAMHTRQIAEHFGVQI